MRLTRADPTHTVVQAPQHDAGARTLRKLPSCSQHRVKNIACLVIAVSLMLIVGWSWDTGSDRVVLQYLNTISTPARSTRLVSHASSRTSPEADPQLLLAKWKDFTDFQTEPDDGTLGVFKQFFNLSKLRDELLPHLQAPTGPLVNQNVSTFYLFNPSVVVVEDGLLLVLRLSSASRANPKADRAPISFVLLMHSSSSQVLWVVPEGDPDLATKCRIRGFEDARAFQHGTTLWLSASAKIKPECDKLDIVLLGVPVKSLMSRFRDAAAARVTTITMRHSAMQYGSRSREKNWMPFFHGNTLYYVYSLEPFIVLRCNPSNGKCKAIQVSSERKDGRARLRDLEQHKENVKTGLSLKGSTAAFRVGDHYLTCAHRGHVSAFYKTLCYTFEADPPFRKLAETPLFAPRVNGAPVQYVAGLARWRGYYWMSYGVNDTYPELLVVPEDDFESTFRAVDAQDE